MSEEKSKTVKVVVHDGAFHADDVFAVAILKKVFDKILIYRSRDPEVWKDCDFRVDVGKEYDPKTGDFDHHQGDLEPRENGMPYASVGLVWKEFGMQFCSSEDVFNRIDEGLVQFIDANDNGVKTYTPGEHKTVTLSALIDRFNPNNFEGERDFDSAFMRAVDFASVILDNEIENSEAKIKAKELVLKAIDEANEKYEGKYIVLDKFLPWKSAAIENSDALFCVFPVSENKWNVSTVPVEVGSFEARKDLPKAWGGLDDEALAEVSGVEDAVFCHKALFIGGAKSKEGALKMVKLALENSE